METELYQIPLISVGLGGGKNISVELFSGGTSYTAPRATMIGACPCQDLGLSAGARHVYILILCKFFSSFFFFF